MSAQAQFAQAPDDRVSTRTELVTREPAEGLAGILDIELPDPAEVPPLWHWVYLPERPAQRALGPDGHPLNGIPATPSPGMRRMFAGGRVTMYCPLRFGEIATRTKRVTSIVQKQGRTGPLTFVTARTEFVQGDRLALVEDQDIVYRAAESTLSRPFPSRAEPDSEGADLGLDVDPTLLFRFSALTYNAHRIHYDREYAAKEGYPDLVVHGPLQVLMMAECLRRRGASFIDQEFAFRLVSPMIGVQRLGVMASAEPLGAEVRSASGRVTATGVFRQNPAPAS